MSKKLTIHQRKNVESRRIFQTMADTKGREEKIDCSYFHRPPLRITKRIYIELDLSYTDIDHRDGYVFDIDEATDTVTRGRYFHADGEGTYTETELSPEELKNAIKCYRIHKKMHEI